jgi:cell shape-determining protein MreC
MIDLKTLDNDPWPTIPVKKNDLRELAKALRFMDGELERLAKQYNRLRDTLMIISGQELEPKSALMAYRALKGDKL